MQARARKLGRRAFTLTEMIITVFLFSLFSTTIVATLSATLHFWTESNSRILAEQNVRLSIQCLTQEVRQALVDADGVTGYNSSNYNLSYPCAIINPNRTNTSTTATTTAATISVPFTLSATAPIAFTEANQSNYTPATSGWSPLVSSDFQLVCYYVSTYNWTSQGTAQTLHRSVTTYTNAGTGTTTDLVVASASSGTPGDPGGQISMSAQYPGAYLDNAVTVTISAIEGTCNYSITTTTAAMGQY